MINEPKYSPSPLGYERVRKRNLLIVACLIVEIDEQVCPRFNDYLAARRRALLGASGDQTAQVFHPLLPDQTRSKLFEALFVVLDALLFVDFLSSSFDIVFYLLSEPLGVDFELPN